jgi:hypothetical protein
MLAKEALTMENGKVWLCDMILIQLIPFPSSLPTPTTKNGGI